MGGALIQEADGSFSQQVRVKGGGSEAADGAAAPANTQQVGGKDGSGNLQALLTGTDGSLVLGVGANRVGEVLTKSAAPAAAATATIANGASLSGAVDLSEERLHRLAMPAAWTGAAITFQASPNNSDWYDLYTEAGEYTLSSSVVAASRSITVDPAVFFGVRYVKVCSGTAGSAVAQGAQRDITLVTVPR